MAVWLTVGTAAAHAFAVHEFLPARSAAISKGVLRGCGTGAAGCVAGELSGLQSMTVDAGHLIAAERIETGPSEGRSRVDRFGGATGEFIPPQLDEEAALGELNHGVAVGHTGAEERIYVGAGDKTTRQNVVAVFGPAGTLQPGGIWAGKGSARGVFEPIQGIAVSSAIGGTSGEVYVATDRVVDVFPGEPEAREPAKAIAELKVTGATGSGTIEGTTDSERRQIKAVSTTFGRFAINQELQGPGIPPGTLIEAVECEGRCLKISAGAAITGSVTLAAFSEPTGVAVSPTTGDVVVSAGPEVECVQGKAECVVDVFEPTPAPSVYNFLFSINGVVGEPFKRIRSVTVDGNGDIYVAEGEANAVDQFDGGGKFIGRTTEGAEGRFKAVRSVAADPALGGDLYVGDYDRVRQTGAVDVFGPTRIAPDVATSGSRAAVKAGPAGEGSIEATLEGTVNPLGQGSATCLFKVGTTEAVGDTRPCDATVPEGNSAVAVQATVRDGLAPGTRYLFRLQASNKNGTNRGEPSENREVVTPGPGIRDESAVDVSASAATLEATLDPNGAPTRYYFQYGKSTRYEATAPAPPGLSIGSVPGSVNAPPQHVEGLAPETVYHYRVVAVSELQVQGGSMQAVSFTGPDQTFTTQTAAAAATLPDGRRWELVSPPDKHGAQLEGNGGPGAIEAAIGGGAISYLAASSIEARVKGTKGQDQVLSMRTGSGWASQDLSLSRATPVSPVLGAEYRFLSGDLSSAIVEPPSEEFSSLTPEVFPPDTERGPYVRHNFTCAATPETCYQPLLVGCPPLGQPCPVAVEQHADVPTGTEFGGDPANGGNETTFGAARVVGASPNAAHLIVASTVGLTQTQTGGQRELYEVTPASAAAQEVQIVGLIPTESGGEVPTPDPALGNGDENVRGAVSDYGTRVVFSSASHLYMRDLASGHTLQLDLPQAECVAEAECGEGEAGAHFQLASPDGSRVLFTDLQRLTKRAGRIAGQEDLYQCEVQEIAGKPGCRLSDLTPAPAPGKAADVRGAVIGASEDGTWVYFVANGVLGDAADMDARSGDCEGRGGQQCNLYVYHEGTTHLIAVLAGRDFRSWAGADPAAITSLVARVSPNGRYLAFMSERSLTGYDNRDAVSGQRDQEVFLYHAETASAGTLVCASCNPTGARPVGIGAGQLGENVVGLSESIWEPHVWLAASVPGWTPYSVGRPSYQTRYLSGEGRLFFDSHDALSAQDINNNEDVYEFEPGGVGSCVSGSRTFQAATGGCVALISSGRSTGESAFLDASESGDDIFFLTAERLVSKDVDTATDVYDAHVCSTAALCSEEVSPTPPCGTAESCHSSLTPEPGVFGTPPTATFSGQGNFLPASPRNLAKPLTRAQKLAKALKACRKKHKRRLRRACEREVRRRYGTAARRARKAGHPHQTPPPRRPQGDHGAPR